MIDLLKKIQEYLISQIKNLTKNRYGIEHKFSDMSMKKRVLSQTIEKDVDITLSPTLFFEYENIEELSQYLLQNHKQNLCKFFQIDITKLQVDPKIDIRVEENQIVADEQNSIGRDIAIIGMAGRFPQAKNVNEFWKKLEQGTDFITEVPKDRWDHSLWFDPQVSKPNKTYSKWGSFLDNVDKFDPLFFGISPREAEWMDPQLRLLLEVIYEGIEDAGYPLKIRGSSTGLYIGSCFKDYWDEISKHNTKINTPYEYISSITSMLTGRISHIFDLHGPSICTDNACASSLTALHLAVSSLRNKECSMAIVAGVNLILSPLHYLYFSQMNALSPTGRCYAFEKSANGYVPGEGAVAILLKPFSKAIEDKDNIHAIIKGSAINHVGKASTPYAPRPKLQTQLVIDAWRDADITPTTISYLEAHGTGTKLGDPIEIKALTRAFSNYTHKKQFCIIGSTKAHLGHLEGAAGLASVVKVILSMKNRIIPTMPNFKEENPILKLSQTPFLINRKNVEWSLQKATQKRRAGVSSFGMMGHNAHVILEEYEQSEKTKIVLETYPVILSAKNKDSLYAQVEQLLKVLEKENLDLADIAYTLQVGREHLQERFAALACSIKSLQEKLKAFISNKSNINECFQGTVKRGQKEFTDLLVDNDIQKTIVSWKSKNKYNKLMNLWVQGLDFDWNKLYGDDKPRIISLPTYPFAKEKCWITSTNNVIANTKTNSDIIHPLLHENISSSLKCMTSELLLQNLKTKINKSKRISLPTYPFAKQRYWITPTLNETLMNSKANVSVTHPLVYGNISGYHSKSNNGFLIEISHIQKPEFIKLQPLVGKNVPKVKNVFLKEKF